MREINVILKHTGHDPDGFYPWPAVEETLSSEESRPLAALGLNGPYTVAELQVKGDEILFVPHEEEIATLIVYNDPEGKIYSKQAHNCYYNSSRVETLPTKFSLSLSRRVAEMWTKARVIPADKTQPVKVDVANTTITGYDNNNEVVCTVRLEEILSNKPAEA